MGFPCDSTGKESPAMKEAWVGKIPWKTERLPTPVFRPRDCKELDTTERLSLHPSVWTEYLYPAPKFTQARPQPAPPRGGWRRSLPAQVGVLGFSGSEPRVRRHHFPGYRWCGVRAGNRTGNARWTRGDRAPSPGGFGAPVARAAPGPPEGLPAQD